MPSRKERSKTPITLPDGTRTFVEDLPKKNANKDNRPEFKGFANIPLTDDDKVRVKAEYESGIPTESYIEWLLDRNFKVTIRMQDENNSCCVTAMPLLTDDVNAGYALSGYGPDLRGAAISVMYKHREKALEGSWSDFTDNKKKDAWG